MTYRYSTTVNNAKLQAIEAAVANPKFQIWTGTSPAIGAGATGTKILEITLPADWMQDAASGQKLKSIAPWTSTGIAPGGTAGYFRITQSDGTTAAIQGDIGADMTLDNTSIATNQTVTVNSFTIIAANT
jgi:hypothetical protein